MTSDPSTVTPTHVSPVRARWRLGLCVLALTGAAAARADDSVVPLAYPKSVADAVRMEKAVALPRSDFYETPSLAGTRPGDLLKSEPSSAYAVPAGARAVRILYHSTDAEGHSVGTSGVVLIPAGSPPAGGWPVIAWAHGTSGVARQCAPSLMRDLEYGEEGLMPMVRAGFAVIATDYHGLGTGGAHQYVNRLAQAHDVIYAVPAAHKAVADLAATWTVIGHSQGGLAAWGVAEQQVSLKDPNYRGAISVAGTADIGDLIGLMGGSANEATFYLTYMAFGVKARTPSFDVSQMLAGQALARYPDVTSRGCWNYAFGKFMHDKGGKSLQTDWRRSAAVQTWIRENAVGSKPISGPFFVIGGEGDNTVPFPSLKKITTRACRAGAKLNFRAYPGLDHDPTMAASTAVQLEWVRDRLAGKPAGDDCPSLIAADAPAN